MFINTLPLIFTHSSLFQPIDLVFFIAVLTCSLYVITPAIMEYWQSDIPHYQEVSYLKLAWLGLLPLWKVFWPFFLVINIGLLTIDSLAKSAHITVSSWDTLHFIFVTPMLWWSVSVWRASSLTNLKVWAILARLATMTVFFEYALKLYIRMDFPRIFFNCEELFLDFASCF